MERVVWGMLAILITSASIGVVVVWRNSEMNSIRYQTLWLAMANKRQEISEWQTESKQATADIRRKQEQSLESLDRVAQNLYNLRSALSMQREEVIKIQNENEKRMEQFVGDLKQMRSTLNVQPGSYRSCKDEAVNVSGVYNIRGEDQSYSFVAYCEQEKFNGGWMVIQHRFVGILDFDRNWKDYRNGFGEVDDEHWLGLEQVYQFTKQQDCELLVELKDFDGTYKYARYDLYAIGSETEQYKLKSLGQHSGTAGDSLISNKGMMFSTPDRDNDNISNYQCAVKSRAGWWFNDCGKTYLNGFYRNETETGVNKISWEGYNNDWRGLSYTRMLIRPLDEKPTETSISNSNEQPEYNESDEFY
ncbi:fibrinogen-like protein 1 [Anopheles aquasalis]|uniref:fibrinogen-like protein 1 n=1 Tax=Anopheles aquasalis TaxID=42839 RepID=UPI00215A7833|nr:fibrinogen-like protein 1 [Anopheles aquasalis]